MDYLSMCPKPDLKMDLTIFNVSCCAGDVLIKFQGQYISSCEFDYHILQREMQLVPKVNEDLDIGEFCLVQEKPLGSWHRGKILNKFRQMFEVVLIDQGNVVKVALEQIASATGELFTLPPKVVNGIFANVLPLDEKWSPRAISYFSNLIGEHLNGHVKTFLPHQVVLLEVPKIIDYAVELNVAKYMDSDTFCLLVEIIHKLPPNSHGKQMPDLLQQKTLTSDIRLNLNDYPPHFQKLLDHLRPDISIGTMEKIRVSAAISPDRFHCRILSWETELHELTANMCSYYESLKTETCSASENYGSLCAAKRKDGQWYRGIIQALMSCSDVKVFFIDIGSSETILSTDVHQLKHEFRVLPMLAIPCALSKVNHPVDSTKNMQVLLFKQALIGHIVIARIEQFCSEEQVFSISLYKKEFELSPDCHLTNQQISIYSHNTYTDIVKSEYEEKSLEMALPTASVTKEMDSEEVISFKSLQMDTDSIYVAYVEYVLNPSNFWIRTDYCQNEFSAMMAEIAKQYDKCELMEMVVEDPQLGQHCCALYPKDCHYYRAVITEVCNPKITVYFIDFGNTETVSFYEVKVLLPKFSILPALAMCCSLAYAYPQDDVWVKSENDVFKDIVVGKALLCHVLEKRKFKYVVEMRLYENSENPDILSLLVQAGYADIWKVDLNSKSVDQDCSLTENSAKCKYKNSKKSVVKGCVTKGDIKMSLRDWTLMTKTKERELLFSESPYNIRSSISPNYFKQYTLKPGTAAHVKCSHVESPGYFWCQLSCNLTALDTLMDEMQTFYKSCKSRNLHGQIACVARSSRTGKYYRASIMKHASVNEVDVIFVDYGMVERVPISELREIKPHFLTWEGQAFRCCLSKTLSSFNTHHTWSGSSIKDFKSFVESATDLKCTVITLFSCASEKLYIAVDLETPFHNANHWLASKGHLLFQDTVPSVHLHTFCFSNFDLEVGSKECIYITFIYKTGKFYCQLAKNENAVDMLMKKVSELGERINPENGKVNELCIVKHFQDGHYYRVSASPVDSDHCLAFFVDFGDSHMVKKSELLPIPMEAADVLFEPMQAIPCYLSGLKEATFNTEAKAWFEKQCVGKTLSVTIVSRDNKGQLEVDLCCGNISINHKLKELLGVVLQLKASNTEASSTSHPICAKKHKLQNLSEKSESYGKDQKTPISNLNGNLIPGFLLEGHQNSMCEALQKESLHDTMQTSELQGFPHANHSCGPPTLKPLKSTDLPQTILETGSTHVVYASHISSPSEFYIQLAENEKQGLQLEEELNAMSFQPMEVNHLVKDSLVVAQYPDDNAFYRARIKDILEGKSFEVEFIDYGNTAIVDVSSIFKLPERFFNVPRLSISVFLTGVQECLNDELRNNAVDKVPETVPNESFSCTFLFQYNNQWEVRIISKEQPVKKFLQSFEASPAPSALDKDTIPRSDIVLKTSQIEKVKNMYLSKNGMLFVTLARYAEESKIGEKISAVVKQADNRLMAKEISVGMVCLTKSEKMQTWFRAVVELIFPRTKEMLVSFVDHGAREVISMHNAKSLSAVALSLPHQAIPCMWSWMAKVGVNVFRSQMRYILQKEVQILFLEFLETQSCWKVDILLDDIKLMEHFNTASQQVTQKMNDAVSCFQFETDMLSSIPRVSLRSLEVQAGYVTAFQNPLSFTVQLESSLVSMNILSELIKKLPDDLLPLPVGLLRTGSACLVKCFEANEWCRAEIASINVSSILLNYPDYGISKSIAYSDYSKLKVISEEIAILPALSYRCKLHGVLPKNGNSWPADAVKYCRDFFQDYDLLIMPIAIEANVTKVSIYGEGSLAEKLISKGLASKVSVNGCMQKQSPI
ncbi:tudor domain-containing protein 15 [Mantella aurantiaca]